MSRRTPLGRVLGLGSAKEGTDHWWSQRVSAVGLAFLGLWFAVSMIGLVGAGASHADVVEWMRTPWRAIALLGLVIVVAWHASLGVQVVIEDYLGGWLKVVALVGQKFVHFLVAVTGVLAVLRVAFGA